MCLIDTDGSQKMKKSKAINKIHRTLQKWEGSKLDKNCAKEILEALEQLGVISPPAIELAPQHLWIPSSGEFTYGPVFSNVWEPESRRK
jgi:hypothetical protein